MGINNARDMIPIWINNYFSIRALDPDKRPIYNDNMEGCTHGDKWYVVYKIGCIECDQLSSLSLFSLSLFS